MTLLVPEPMQLDSYHLSVAESHSSMPGVTTTPSGRYNPDSPYDLSIITYSSYDLDPFTLCSSVHPRSNGLLWELNFPPTPQEAPSLEEKDHEEVRNPHHFR